METAPAPQKESTESEKRPWPVVEEDIKTPEDGKIHLEQGLELYKESKEAFNEQVKVRDYGKVGLDAFKEEQAQDIGTTSLSDAEKLKLKELNDVQNGNINENNRM
jgi:hypothetical protein